MQGDVPTMVKYQRCIKDIILLATYIRFLDKKGCMLALIQTTFLTTK